MKEEKLIEFKKALDHYEDRIARITGEYRYKFDHMQPNEAGEYSAEKVLELNEQYRQEKAKALEEFAEVWRKASEVEQ